jgi:predicted esterase
MAAMETTRPLLPTSMMLALAVGVAGQDEQEDLPPAQDLRVGDDDTQRYFLIGPRDEKAKPPAAGYKLLLVLPGGDGSADFAMFVRRIAAHATTDQWLVAQLVAPVWNEKQAKELVWPTRKHPADGMKFATEDFVAAVIRDVETRQPVDPAFVFTLAWSSSGPAAYAASLDPKIGITGSFVAMSVWKPDQLPKLDAAKGHAYWLLHSPADFIPIAMAESAKKDLKKRGAEVELERYEGGHGWKGDVYGMMRRGIEWLEEHHAAPSKERLAERKKAGKGKGGATDSSGGKDGKDGG